MKLETFFESFAPLADAPNGLQKLRELILQLAVQGKLVTQDAHDEPVSVLLAKIKAEKERLIQEKKIRKSEPLPIEANEVPFDLPQGWEWIRLDDFASISTGFAFKSPDYTQSGVFVLRVTNIQSDGVINKHEAVFFPEDKITPQLAKHYLSAGEILVVMVGGSLGKLGVVTPELLPALLNQNMWRINALYGECPRDFLLLALKYINGFQLKVTQSTHGHLSMEEYRQQILALPPLAEQRRIVAKVDQLMALCDELEARQQRQQTARVKLNNAALEGLLTARAPAEFAEHWQRICDNFDLLYDAPETLSQLRQAVLQLAVQGKLVPQDAHDEPAAVLLAKIKAEKERLIQEKKIKKSEPLPPIEAGEVPFDLPKAWEWVRLDDVCHDCGQKVPNQPFTYIDVSSINKERGIISEEVKLLTAANAPSRARKLVEVGTVIYSTVRPYLLNIAIIDKAFDPEPIVSTAFAVLHPLRGLFNKFLYHYLRSKPFIEYVEAEMTGMAYPAINDTKLQKGLVPLPPLAEQRRIVAKVDQVMALCDELEAKLRQAQTASAKLMTVAVQLLAAESV